MLRSILAAYRAAFAGLPRQVWVLALVAFVNRSGTMVLPFLTLYLTRTRGFTVREAGQFLSLYGLGGIAGAYAGGWLADRASARLVQVGSLLGGGVLLVILGRMESRFGIGAMVVATAFVMDALRPANMASVAAACSPALRSRAFALTRLAVNAGMTIGPAVGGFLALTDYGLLFLVDGGTCVAAGLLVIFLLRAAPPRPPSDAGIPATTPWSDPVFLVFLLLTAGFAMIFFQIDTTFPLYLREAYAFSENRIGLMFTVNTVIIITFEMLLIKRLEAWRPLRAIAVGLVLTGVGFGLLPLGSTMGFAAMTVSVWTVGEMMTMPIMTTFVSSRADDGSQGRYMALYSIAFSVGLVLSPLIGTWLYQEISPRSVWAAALFGGLASAAAIILLDHGARARPRPAVSASRSRT
jgi:predicted MFS family arabinose efflux permease